MPLTTSASFDDLNRKSNAWLRALTGFQKPMRQWIMGVALAIQRAWKITYQDLYNGSMPFRGEAQWGAVPPQYTRITDGVAVPPWGGVKRIRGEILHFASVIATGKKLYRRAEKVYGNVKGRLRASGKRITRSSVVGADTGQMRRDFVSNPVFSSDGRAIRLVSTLKRAEYFNAARPFAFLTQIDVRDFRNRMAAWLGETVKTSFR